MSFKIVLNNRHRQPTGLVGRLADSVAASSGVLAASACCSLPASCWGSALRSASPARTTRTCRPRSTQQASRARRRPRDVAARDQCPGRAPGRTAGPGQPPQRARRAPDPRRPAAGRRVRFRHSRSATVAPVRVRDMPRGELHREPDLAREGVRPLRASSSPCWKRCCSTASSTATRCRRAIRSPTATSPPASAAAPIRSAAAASSTRASISRPNVGDPGAGRRRRRGQLLRRALGLRQRGRSRPRQRLRHPLRPQLAPDRPRRRPGPRRAARSPRPAPPAVPPAPTCISRSGRTAASVNPRKFLGQTRQPLRHAGLIRANWKLREGMRARRADAA